MVWSCQIEVSSETYKHRAKRRVVHRFFTEVMCISYIIYIYTLNFNKLAREKIRVHMCLN